jgi:hypothetical protein
MGKWTSVFALVTMVGMSSPVRAEEWECDLGFYLWMCGLEGTIGSGPVDAPVSAEFTDLASYLDFALAGYFEARKPRYILATDISYVNLGEERTAQIGASTIEVSLDVKQYIGEVGGAYRLTPEFDVWLAGRLYSLQSDVAVQGETAGAARQTWGDIYVGARYHRNFAEKWIAGVRADIGAGGSDFAWFGNAVVGYHFTETFTLGLGYRILSLDRESTDGDESFRWDVVQDGIGIYTNFSL